MSQVEYNESFRLYCTTRLPRPHFTPELSANVTLVDFTVTQAGLEDQLLGKLILKACLSLLTCPSPCYFLECQNGQSAEM